MGIRLHPNPHEMGETEPLLAGVRKDIVLDPTTELAGFIAAELEQPELLSSTDYTDLESNGQKTELSWAKTNIIVGSMSIGVFLAAVDMTIVTTLIGDIASEFDSLDKLSWIASGYLLSSATFQPLYGKVSDIFGRRSLLLFANVTFALGCLICCLAPRVEVLVLGRFISGIGGGGLTSMTSITTSDLIPLKSRGVYQGVTNIAFASGSAIGSLLGGYFVSHDIVGGWRGAFAIQVPITLLSTLTIYSLLELPKGSPGLGVHGADIKKKAKLVDWVGSFTLVITLVTFLALTSVHGDDYLSFKSMGLSMATLLFLACFIYAESIARFPILPLSFMKIPTVLGVSLSNFFLSISVFNCYFIITIYYTAVMGLSSQQVGYRFTPNFFSIILGSLGAGYYMRSTGKYYKLLLVSGIITILGTWRVATIPRDYPTWAQYLLLVVPGLGGSVIVTATLLALIAAVPHEHQAATTSISYLFRSCGSTLGVSIGAAIFQQRLNVELTTNVIKFIGEHPEEELLNIISKAKHSTEYIHRQAPEWVREALVLSYEHSCKLSLNFCVASTVLAFLSLLLINEYVLHSTLKR